MFDRVKRAGRDRLIRAVEDATKPQAAETRRLLEEILRLHDRVGELEHQLWHEMPARLAGLEHRDRRDMEAAADREAVASSAAYVRDHFAEAVGHRDPHDTLRAALAAAPTGGLALEFGVFSGTTLAIIAQERSEVVYGFDVFTGLPEAWRPGYPAGFFGVDEPPVVEGAEMVVGLFEDTTADFLAEHPGDVDLLHVDCDLYSGAVTVLREVGPRLRPGSIVVFDEYLNHPGWQSGEFQAWAEHVARTGISYEYVAYTIDHEQVVVRVTDVP